MAQLELLDPRWCQLKTLPGRAISAGDVADADALLLRSVTRVDEQLLKHSAVRFVGTATIGTDHIDTGLLARKGVGFAYAPGCNANAVVDYVLAAIFAEFSHGELARKRIGIIGCGNVGQRLLACLDHFGLRATVYDPLLQPGVLAANYACDEAGALDAVLNCDIVSLHVPLTESGEHATLGLLNAARLQRLPDGAMLLNTSRGEVIDNRALTKVAQQRSDLRLVLDVFAQEPQPSVALVKRANYATPHIAGY
ncbi:MAG: 4-phosphoerythronate dehydrogenase, partial [Gammaproteobacteria bacterium]|nr:4-phosphoerythronate dehydrogenase [Gammaproteobacteria bacterium]